MFERTALEINAELERARQKFPMPNPTFVALAEEVGELAEALLKCNPLKPDYARLCKNVYDEAKQVAAMAVRVMEEGDSFFPGYVIHLGMSDNEPDGTTGKPNWPFDNLDGTTGKPIGLDGF